MLPNPTSGVFDIKYTGHDSFGNLIDNIVTVYDTQGRVIYETKVSGELTHIDLTDFYPGVYYIQVHGKKGVFVTPVVKQ